MEEKLTPSESHKPAAPHNVPPLHDPFRVAHLSDIHFNSKFDRHQWAYVRAVLARQRPDLVVVTGDCVNHPFPLMLVLARRELLDLEESLRVPVIVIPGNHDVAFAGSVRIPVFTRLFHATFSPERKRWIHECFPTFVRFYSKGWLRRSCWRIVLYTRILVALFKPDLRPSKSRDKVDVYTDLGPLWLAGFDSNRSMFLASGKVPQAQIYDFGIHALEFDDAKTFEQALLPRLALLHHHLVPIPYTRKEIGGMEQFLVLQNAGTVLKELCEHDFDLVLHGHRHYACFSRLAYGDQSHEPREIAVLSAASPTVPQPEAGFNSLHLIDLHRNGQIRIHEYRFGAGQTIASPHHSEQPIVEALPLHSLKTRNFRRAVTLQKHECGEIAREVSIDASGQAISRLIVQNLRVGRGTKMEFHDCKLKASRGSLDSQAVYQVSDSSLWSPQCTLVSKEQKVTTAVEHEIRINPPLTEGWGINYAIEYISTNNFAMTGWECDWTAKHEKLESDHRYSPAEESIGFRVKFPTRSLRLRVTLPKILNNRAPYVRCSMPEDYPKLKLDENHEVIGTGHDIDDSYWQPDGKMSDYESGFLRQLSEDTWEWRIDYPLVGYRYELCWHVEDVREVSADLPLIGLTEACRKLFLEYARLIYKDPSATARELVTNPLRSDLLDEFYEKYKDPITGSDEFRIGVFAFDGDSGDLVLVEEVRTLGAKPVQPNKDGFFTIPFGEGVAGMTFKHCEATAYFRPAVNHRSARGVDFFKQANELGLQAVLGIPIFHPDAWIKLGDIVSREKRKPDQSDFPGIQEAIGVITIASNSEASGISEFSDRDPAGMLEIQLKVMKHIPDLIQNISRAILEIKQNRPHNQQHGPEKEI